MPEAAKENGGGGKAEGRSFYGNCRGRRGEEKGVRINRKKGGVTSPK